MLVEYRPVARQNKNRIGRPNEHMRSEKIETSCSRLRNGCGRPSVRYKPKNQKGADLLRWGFRIDKQVPHRQLGLLIEPTVAYFHSPIQRIAECLSSH